MDLRRPAPQPRSERNATWRLTTATAVITAAIASAVAVTAVAGATGEHAGESTFVPITPCRLLDTRPAPATVGPRSTPIGADETHIQQVTGANGECTIPTDATGVALNATAVQPTASSFATFWPAGEQRPLSSNLNYVPGQAPTPNKIDVKLSPDGRLAIYNLVGSVDMVVDVSGYYTAAGLDRMNDEIAAKPDRDEVALRDETYTMAEVDQLIEAAVAGLEPDVYGKAEVDAMLATKADAADVYTTAELDAMHQLLYTKDEVDELLVHERVWGARVSSLGGKLTPGPYTTTRLGVGEYEFVFDLAAFHIPATNESPVITAMPRCPAMVGYTGGASAFFDGEITSLTVRVIVADGAGGTLDCSVDLQVKFGNG